MKRLILAALMLISSLATAVQKVDLYSAEQLLPVGAKQTQINQAIVLGLSEVITRITGSREFGESDYVTQALKANAASLLESYAFVATDVTLTDRLGDPIAAQILSLKFNTEKVLNIVRQQGWPVWTESRPEVLLWGILASNQDTQLVAFETLAEFSEALESASKRRGLPILWPWGDLADMQQMLPQSFWLSDFSNDMWLLDRYQNDVNARFVLRQTGGSWEFEYRSDADSEIKRISADSLAMVAEIWVDQMSERFATELRIERTTVNQLLLLQVTNVRSLADHLKIERYLQNLTVVNDVKLLSQKSDTLVFKLSTPASIEQFRDILAVERFMQPDMELDMFVDELNYRFQGN